MVSIVNKRNIDNPKGVILEAPFNNMRDEVIKHPFSWVRLTDTLKVTRKGMTTLLETLENGFSFNKLLSRFKERKRN